MKSLRLLLPLLLIALVASACADADSDRSTSSDEAIEEEIERTQERLDELRDRLDDLADSREDDVRRVREQAERVRDDADRIRDETRESTEAWREDVGRAVESSLVEIGRALERVGQEMQENSDVQPVDWRDMKSMLPEDIAGFERIDWEGHNKQAIGIRMATIKGDYERGEDRLNLAVVDLGSLSGLATAGYDWLDAHIDSETDRGYERTQEIEGYPGFVEVEYSSHRDELSAVVIVEERFVIAVNIEGQNLDDALLMEAIDDVPFDRLRDMID